MDGSETKDVAVAAFADANDKVLVTKDSDFRDSHFLTGSPSRLIRVTMENLPNTALLALFDEHWEALARVFAASTRYVELGRDGVVVYE